MIFKKKSSTNITISTICIQKIARKGKLKNQIKSCDQCLNLKYYSGFLQCHKTCYVINMDATQTNKNMHMTIKQTLQLTNDLLK